MKSSGIVISKTAREYVLIKAAIKIVAVLLFSLATSAGALVRIPLPFTPVPITLQTYFVLLSGLTLGTFFGPLSQAIYLLYGVFGLPVFAGGKAGVAILFGPTGGYLVGFIVASYICGFAARAHTPPLLQFLYLITATVLIYALGIFVLSLNLNASINTAITKGVLPFIPMDLLKLSAAYGSWFYGKKIFKGVFGKETE